MFSKVKQYLLQCIRKAPGSGQKREMVGRILFALSVKKFVGAWSPTGLLALPPSGEAGVSTPLPLSATQARYMDGFMMSVHAPTTGTTLCIRLAICGQLARLATYHPCVHLYRGNSSNSIIKESVFIEDMRTSRVNK